MLDDPPAGSGLADQFLEIARDPALRESVYGRLRDYCHQSRNHLNSFKLGIYLARRQSDDGLATPWESVERAYINLEERIERVQLICRPSVLSMMTLRIGLLMADRRASWAAILADGGCSLDCDPPEEDATARFDAERLGTALDAFAAWRAGFGPPGREIRLTWGVESGIAVVRWSERGTVGPSREDDPTLALPLLARVIADHGGELVEEGWGGYRLELRWPTSKT